MKNHNYRSLAECVLTGQVSHQDAIKIMSDDPEFAAWYRTNILEEVEAGGCAPPIIASRKDE